MSSVKLTPFVLFFILLIVLVISVIFGYRGVSEGFITYEFNKQPIDSVWIPQYTTDPTRETVVKLYDNVFFDSKNGNLIEVDASSNGSISNFDNTGATITSLYVTSRLNPTVTVKYGVNVSGGTVTPQDTADSLVSTLSNSYTSFDYPTQSQNTDKYSVFYMPWNDSTHIHIIDNSSTTVPANNIGTFMFGPANTMEKKIYPANSAVGITRYVDDNDPNNNKSIVNALYDSSNQVFQISQYVSFDTKNANLIIDNSTGTNKTILVYDRNGVQITPTTKSKEIQNVTFTAYTILDTNGQNLVLYSAIGKKTLVAVIHYKDATLTKHGFRNVKRFTEKGLDSGPNTAPSPTTTGTTCPIPVDVAPPAELSPQLPNQLDLASLALYWQTQGTPSNKPQFSEDYLLKTQIIPPVCPACASCPACAKPDISGSLVTCTNCGGQGGSGTLTTGGTSVVQNKDTRTNIAGAVSNVGSSVGNVANTAITTTGGLISSAGSGAKELAVDTVTGAKNLVVGAAKETEELLKSAGTGVKDILTQGSRQNSSYGRGSLYGQNSVSKQGRQQQGDYSGVNGGSYQTATDQYSYYGTLPAKGDANYMPVTADFSAFGR